MCGFHGRACSESGSPCTLTNWNERDGGKPEHGILNSQPWRPLPSFNSPYSFYFLVCYLTSASPTTPTSGPGPVPQHLSPGLRFHLMKDFSYFSLKNFESQSPGKLFKGYSGWRQEELSGNGLNFPPW